MNRLGIIGIALIVVAVVGFTVTASLAGPGLGTGWGWMGWMHGDVDDCCGPGGYASPSAAPIPGAPEVVIGATEFSFEPSTVEVPTGKPVNLTLVNDGSTVHNLTIPALGVSVVAGPGQRATVGFVAPAPGTYQIVCTIPGHAEAGMTGTLVVGS